MSYESFLIGEDRTTQRPEEDPNTQGPKNGKALGDVQRILSARQSRVAARAGGPQERFSNRRAGSQVRVVEESFGVANAGNLGRADASSSGVTGTARMTRTTADQTLKAMRARAPQGEGDWIVVSECEVAA